MNPMLVPKEMPEYPDVESLRDLNPDEARYRIESYIENLQATYSENFARFEKSMNRIKICAFLKGFFSFGLNYDIDDHFAWCPARIWKDYFKSSVVVEFEENKAKS